jgi:nitroreductase
MKELSTSQVSTVVADANSVDAAILSRFSARAYLNKPVEKSVLEDLLQVAARAPSGTNTQPWKVYVLQGATKDKLVNEKKSLKSLILEMEDEVLANAGVDVFENEEPEDLTMTWL